MRAVEPLPTGRFAIREARLDDAEGIARAHVESWKVSYRGILPDELLDRIDVGQRADTRRRILRDRSIFQLVAYDTTHRDIVGFCDAGPSRRHAQYGGELYAIYLVHHAKRHGIGAEMLTRVRAWFAESDRHSLVVWVLENNHHARGFYEALGGRPAASVSSRVGGFPVVEVSYVWDRL